MRGEVQVKAIKPVKDKALVRLVDRSALSKREFAVIRQGYDPSDDWELAVVEALGEGDFEPVEVGDRVIVRAISGGKAGADVSRQLGERRETHVIVRADEILVKIG